MKYLMDMMDSMRRGIWMHKAKRGLVSEGYRPIRTSSDFLDVYDPALVKPDTTPCEPTSGHGVWVGVVHFVPGEGAKFETYGREGERTKRVAESLGLNVES